MEWSIIIPALNEERHIERCLESLSSQNLQGSIEVIVVDNGSTDRTCAIAQSFSPRLHVHVIHRPNLKVGAVRNSGVDSSRGRFLAFLDADCAVEPGWLEAATKLMHQFPGAIIGAQYALPPNAGWPARVWHRRFHDHKRGETSYVPGGNLLVELEVFRKIGGFDPNLRSNEDSQFCSRGRAIGVRVLAFGELAAIHFGAERNLVHFARRQFWHGSNVLNAAGARGNIRAIALAAFTLTCVFALIISGLVRQPALLLLSMLGLLLAPTAVALVGVRQDWKYRDLPCLLILLLTYSLVRAVVLPLAVIRAFDHQLKES